MKTTVKLYVTESHKSLRVNIHSIVCLNVKELLARSRCRYHNVEKLNELKFDVWS